MEKQQKEGKYSHYLIVTLKDTRLIVEEFSKKRKWSAAVAADELVKAGAVYYGLVKPEDVGL